MAHSSTPDTNQLAKAYRQALDALRGQRYQFALAQAERLITAIPPDAQVFSLAALAARGLGAVEKAEFYWRAAINAKPNFAGAYNDLGILLKELGRLDEARTLFHKALELQPAFPAAQVNLGNLLRKLGQAAEAEAAYRQTLVLQPDHADAFYNLGLLLLDQERIAEAEATFRQGMAAHPDQGDIPLQLGKLLSRSGRTSEAEAAYRAAIRATPGLADAHFHLAALLMESRRYPEALTSLRHTLDNNPRHAEALNCFGNLMRELGQPEKAEMALRRALELVPDSATVHNNLGVLLMDVNRLGEAEAEFRRAVALEPRYGHALGQAVTCARQRYAWKSFDEDSQAILAALQDGVEGIPALMVHTLTEADGPLRRRAAVLASQAALRPYLEAPPVAPGLSRKGRTRLRVGYLSADFREHAVMHLVAGVLETHDRRRFDVAAYSLGLDTGDTYRQRVVGACKTFRDLRAVSSVDAARQIAEDGIDILVDLGGHTAGSRPEITAMRPAPVIVSWLGFPGTLGHARLADYIIGDSILTPPEHQPHYSETLALMPHCYQPNDDLPITAAPTRQAAGLPVAGFVFCSFHQGHKLNPETFTIWCRLLAAVPGSVLWLLDPKVAGAIDNLRREAAARGIEADRLIFAPPLRLADHLARLQLADLALDTFPYGAGATGSTILRAGVPIVTRLGEAYVSRMAASQLHAVGLPDLVTDSWDAYLDLATGLALDPAAMSNLRARLTANLAATPLFDTRRFTRDLEALYQRIWVAHEGGERAPIGPLPAA